MEIVHFNVLFFHLFAALTRSQAMNIMQINTFKLITVTTVMGCSFPVIKSRNNKCTPILSAYKGVGLGGKGVWWGPEKNVVCA